jgi:hypothetical protein
MIVLKHTFTNNTGGTFSVNALSDIRVTGGTFSNGTASFTNSTGGTFNVGGLLLVHQVVILMLVVYIPHKIIYNSAKRNS